MRSGLVEVQLRRSLGLLEMKTKPKCKGPDLTDTHRGIFSIHLKKEKKESIAELWCNH